MALYLSPFKMDDVENTQTSEDKHIIWTSIQGYNVLQGYAGRKVRGMGHGDFGVAAIPNILIGSPIKVGQAK